MIGIILAGGSGTRLYPLTQVTSKQLLPVYDKPMIYYPLSVLMNAGINDIIIISTPKDIDRMCDLLGYGAKFGVSIRYMVQDKPRGIAEAFLIAQDYIYKNGKPEPVTLILGDNIFAGHGLEDKVKNAITRAENGDGSTIFGYYVEDPERFGVVEFDENGKVIFLKEKPSKPKSNYCVTGLYVYDNKVVKYAKTLKPSKRNELEITDLNKLYLKDDKLNVEILGQGFTWMDAGTHESLAEASMFVKTVEKHQHRKIACLEEIAYNNNWISRVDLIYLAGFYNNQYGKYLLDIANGKYH